MILNEKILTEARAFLKRCREENDRQSEKIVEVFKEIIAPSISKLGDESEYLIHFIILFLNGKVFVSICCN